MANGDDFPAESPFVRAGSCLPWPNNSFHSRECATPESFVSVGPIDSPVTLPSRRQSNCPCDLRDTAIADARSGRYDENPPARNLIRAGRDSTHQ